MALPLIDSDTKTMLSTGFVRRIDVVFMAVWVLYVVTFIYWCIFAHPELLAIMVALFVLGLLTQVWAILVLIRICRLIVELFDGLSGLPSEIVRLLTQSMQSPPDQPVK